MYLLANQQSELERLQLQSRVWEPAGASLLAGLPAGEGQRALEVGCGVMGWLRLLSRWTGATGTVVGTDFDERMLAGAQALVDSDGLANVSLMKDDLFASALPPASFDLVHARFQIAPLGRAAEQIRVYTRWLRPGGVLVLEDPDMASWRVNPAAPATERLIALIEEGFRLGGGNFNAGRELPQLLGDAGIEPRVAAHVVGLPSGHPYLRLPVQFAASLRPRLEKIVPTAELDRLVADAEAEIARPESWGTTFTLIQAFGVLPVQRGAAAEAAGSGNDA